MMGLVLTAIAFARTSYLARELHGRQELKRYQQSQLDRFLTRDVQKVALYKHVGAVRLDQLPLLNKEIMLTKFGRLNVDGITLNQVRGALDSGKATVGRFTVGQSSGTSGNRGVFLVSEAERFTWLGILLAKALPDVLLRRHRVAVALPGSRLYAAAAESGWLALRVFDPAEGVEASREAMVAFAPDVLVAAPRTLLRMAEWPDLRPRHVFSGSEVLDPLDRAALESAWGVRVREIYMATEGLLGVACPHGTLHLAEDVVAFEWEPAAAVSGLVKPVITDFTRRSQVMARYRMNDLLALSSTPCPCGSPLQAVEAVVGRADDLFLLEGGRVTVTPDVVRSAVVDADRRIEDFRVVQEGRERIVLSLTPDLPEAAATAARTALGLAFQRLGTNPEVILRRGLDDDPARKLRRVRRAWSPPTGA